MKIAFDLRRIKNPGIGRYMQCLTEAVLAQKTQHEFLLILPPDAQEMVQSNGSGAEKLSCHIKYYSIREQVELPRILRAHKIDLLHSPHFMLPLLSSCPAVVTIHDVIYLTCPDDLPSRIGRLYYRQMIAASSRRARRIITGSWFSKADIVQHLKTDPQRVEVIYPAVSSVFRPMREKSEIAAVHAKYGINREYILYTGIYKPRKNHAGLLRAFREFLAGGAAAQLVIAGPMNEGEAELKTLARELGIADHMVLTGEVRDSELAILYSAARVYACPSLYEGFGFTVLEAMACGAPVVCSPETSLPEVAGDAAIYANARNPQEFAHALNRVFSSNDLRAELLARGYKNCQRFSWTRAAAQTIDLYEQAIAQEARQAVHA
jgi:glycosyltransferase involved in cell wall biosynthesis